MKALNWIIAACLMTAFFSCQQEESLIEQEPEVKTFTFRHGEKTFEIDYQLEDQKLTLLTEFPDELKALRKNDNISLRLGENDELLLVEDSEIYTRSESSSLMNSTGDVLSVDPGFISTFGLGEVNHFAFVVSDLYDAVSTYTDEFDAKKWWYKPRLKQKKYFIGNQDLNYSVDLIFGFSGRKMLEIIEADDTEDNIFGGFLAQQEGLHHIGFSVSNLSREAAKFRDLGYDVILSGDFRTNLGLISKLTFHDTRDLIGAYTELVESRLFGFNVTQDEALFIFGSLVGDVELIYEPSL